MKEIKTLIKCLEELDKAVQLTKKDVKNFIPPSPTPRDDLEARIKKLCEISALAEKEKNKNDKENIEKKFRQLLRLTLDKHTKETK